MSKTFKSAHAENSYQQLNIAEVDAGIRVSVDHNSHGVKGVIIAPSDAPALALAILEAAGVEPVSGWIKAPLMGSPEQLAVIAQKLVLWIEASESHAKAQAELEAEAREFYDAYHSAADWPYQDWVMLEDRYKAQFFAVALKAREIGAEK